MTTPIFVCTHKISTRAFGGWYVDGSCGFVPDIEELYNNLVCFAPEVIELEEDPEEDETLAPPTNERRLRR